jgi:hypothetical protein
MDHEWLYDGATDGIDASALGVGLDGAPIAFGSWFTPFGEDRYVHPSATDEPEAAAR